MLCSSPLFEARSRETVAACSRSTLPCPRPARRAEEGDFAARLLVSNELVADLRAIAVNDYNSPAIEGEIHDRAEAFASVAELVADCGSLTRWGKRVATDCDYCRPGFGHLWSRSNEGAERIIGDPERLEIRSGQRGTHSVVQSRHG